MVYCTDPEAHGRCVAWLDHLRHATRFAFGAQNAPGALPRRAASRLQRGGLLGTAELLDGGPVKRVDDVAALLSRLETRYDSIEEVPLATVVRRIQEDDDDG